MRMLERNKQKMTFAHGGKEIKRKKAQRDKDGNVIWVETSETMTVYELGGEFRANINNKLTDTDMVPYGLDLSDTYLQIVANKGLLSLKKGDVIWKKSDIAYKEIGGDQYPDEDSADYVVKQVADEGLNVDLFLLQRVTNET